MTNLRRFHRFPFGDPALAVQHGLDRLFVADLAESSHGQEVVAALRDATDEVADAWLESAGSLAQVFPNDPEFSRLYGLHNDDHG